MGMTRPVFQQYSTTPRYNTKVVVRKTGVPADTFRAWERRYHVPQPYRDASNQRLYSEQDVALIGWLRDRTAEGLTISHAIALLRTAEPVPGDQGQARSVAALRDDLLHALLAFDAQGADHVLSEAFALHALDTVCNEIMDPTLVELGALWEAGEASVAQEHFSSQLLRQKLLTLLHTYAVREGRATVVAACLPGEQHELGLLMIALLLARRSYHVVYLGADLPIDALQHAIGAVRPQIVCLSVSQPSLLAQALPQIPTLRSDAPDRHVVIGGAGVAGHPPAVDGIRILTDQHVAAVDAIEQLLASTSARAR